MKINIYTDGACIGNPGQVAGPYFIKENKKKNCLEGKTYNKQPNGINC